MTILLAKHIIFLYNRVKSKNNMKIITILGSPRRNGNTELLLNRFIEGASNKNVIEKIVLNELRFFPCQNCDGCLNTGVCILQDDLTSLYSKIEQAEVVVIATPVFFGSVSAQTKMMIDRFQAVWVAKNKLNRFFKKKEGYLLVVTGQRKNRFFKNVKETVKMFFNILNIEYKDELFVAGVNRKGEILNHPEILEKSYHMGKKLRK